MIEGKRPKARIIRAATNVENIPVLVDVPKGEEADGGYAQARLVDLGDQGVQIEVICHCGKKIVLECTFDEPAVGKQNERLEA